MIKAFEDLFKKTFVDTPTQIDAVDRSQTSPTNHIDSTTLNSIVLAVAPMVLSVVSEVLSQIEATPLEQPVQYVPPATVDNDLITRQPTAFKSTVNLSDAAGVGLATLTNAPVSSNPTKWISIDDNGTIRHIPTW
jgi:hypothetical protein